MTAYTPSGGSSASRAFGYDAYGNMWIPANNGLPIGANPAPPSAPSASNNQLFGATCDSSGNQQSFGTRTLAYDAESRQVSETPVAAACLLQAAGGTVALSADLYKNAKERADRLKKQAGESRQMQREYVAASEGR